MRKIVPVVAAGVTALALAGGTFGYAMADKNVTLSVDGQARQVDTFAGTVGDLLASEGVSVGQRDVVAPAPSTKLSEGTRVAVQFARQVTFSVDGVPQSVWTTATTVDGALGALGIDTAGAALSTSRSTSIGRQGLSLAVDTAKQVTLDKAGRSRTLTTTARTVGDLLAQADIEVDHNDIVSLDAGAPLVDGAEVAFTKVDVSTKKSRSTVAYRTVRKDMSSLTKGTTRVQTAGRSGSRTTTYKVTKHNGKVVKTTKVSSKVTRKPTTRVILVGTKKPTEKSSGSSGGAPSVPSGSVWDRLAKCEAGGNWHINTGNGFYGGLQFTLSTWRAYGGSGMPHKASRERQIAIGKRVQKGQGWGAWPACSRKLGLR